MGEGLERVMKEVIEEEMNEVMEKMKCMVMVDFGTSGHIYRAAGAAPTGNFAFQAVPQTVKISSSIEKCIYFRYSWNIWFPSKPFHTLFMTVEQGFISISINRTQYLYDKIKIIKNLPLNNLRYIQIHFRLEDIGSLWKISTPSKSNFKTQNHRPWTSWKSQFKRRKSF